MIDCHRLITPGLSNQRNIQILDVWQKPIKTFVSGLSLQFLPTPTLLLGKAWYSGYIDRILMSYNLQVL